MHQHEGGLVLDVEVTGELNRREPLRCVHEQADRAEQVDEGELARGKDRARRDAELVVTGSAFEAAPRRQVIDVKAAAYRADRRPIGFRPAQPAEPPIRRILTFGENRLERQRSRGLFSDIALEGSATSEMTGWAERRPGVARL